MDKELTTNKTDKSVRNIFRTPRYRKHSTSDFGFVEVDGKRHRLPGKHNSAESVAAYHDFCAALKRGAPVAVINSPLGEAMLIAVLAARYLEHSARHYGATKRGEHRNNMDAISHLLKHCATVRVVDFGPKKLIELQHRLAETKKRIRRGNASIETSQTLSRKYVNSLVERIRRLFSWGVSQELVSGAQYHALSQVKGLRRGRSAARETAKRKAVPLRYVAPVLRHVPRVVRAMLRVQVFTGVRSGSICNARPEQFDTTGDVWLWRPQHKTEYLERELVIPIGPRCQRVLRPYLTTARPGDFLFSPRSVANNRRYNKRYRSQSYCVAVVRGIRRANKARKPDEQIPHWTPHFIRHYKGDTVNAKYGIEAAQAVLGHDDMSATKLYRSRRLDLATRVAKETG